MRDLEPLPLKQLLFSPAGRIGRRTWWLWGVAMPLGLALYLTVLLRVVGVPSQATDVLINLLLVWPTVCICIKRWHDRGKSGWWVFVTLIPFIGWLWALIENGLLRGNVLANRFGEPAAGDK